MNITDLDFTFTEISQHSPLLKRIINLKSNNTSKATILSYKDDSTKDIDNIIDLYSQKSTIIDKVNLKIKKDANKSLAYKKLYTKNAKIPNSIDVDYLISKYFSEYSTTIKNNMYDSICRLLHIMTTKVLLIDSVRDGELTSLHSTILQKTIGKNYNTILNILVSENILVTNKSYKVGSYSMGYNFTSEHLNSMFNDKGLVVLPYKGKMIPKCIMKNEIDNINTLIQEEDICYKYQYIMLQNISFDCDMFKLIESLRGKQHHKKNKLYTDFEIAFYKEQIRKILDKEIFFIHDDKTYRLFTSITSLPHILRDHILIFGEKLEEIDIPSSQPALALSLCQNLTIKERINVIKQSDEYICLNYKLNNDKKYNKTEIKLILENHINIKLKKIEKTLIDMLKDIKNAEFYDKIQNTHNTLYKNNHIMMNEKRKNKGYKELKLNEKNIKSRSNIKVDIFTLFFANEIKYKKSNFFNALNKLYPMYIECLLYIKEEKTKENKNFAVELQNLEARIMKEVMTYASTKNIFHYTVHDSISVPKNQKSEFINLLNNAIIKFTKIDKLMDSKYKENFQIRKKIINTKSLYFKHLSTINNSISNTIKSSNLNNKPIILNNPSNYKFTLYMLEKNFDNIKANLYLEDCFIEYDIGYG